VVKQAQQEVNYRLSKWLIWNTGIEQLLTPDEVENIFRELLSFYDPPTKCVERVQSMFNRENSTLPFKFSVRRTPPLFALPAVNGSPFTEMISESTAATIAISSTGLVTAQQ